MAPSYSKWLKYRTFKNDDEGPSVSRLYESNFMIILIWFLWGYNIVTGMIILLNFLIAIVSESYHVVNNRKEFYRYKHRSDINKEMLIYYEFFSRRLPCIKRMKSFNCLLIQSEYHGDDTDQWVGMLKKIQISIKDQGSEIKDHTI